MKHELAATHVRTKDDVLVFEVDTKKARYFGQVWRDLSTYQKRKFENLLALRYPGQPMHIIYL